MIELTMQTKKEAYLKKVYRFMIIFILFLVAIAILFINYVLKYEELAAQQYLEAVAIQTASNIKSRISNQKYELSLLASEMTAKIDNFSDAEFRNFLLKKVNLEQYFRLGFAFPDGRALRFQENIGEIEHVDYSNINCFHEALAGKPCLEKIVKMPEAKSGYVNQYFVPVYSEKNTLVGVLCGQYEVTKFQKILSYATFKGNAYANIINSDGRFLIKHKSIDSKGQNFFDLPIKFINNTKEDIQNQMKEKEHFFFQFKNKIDGKIYCAALASIGERDGFVLIDIPKDILMLNIKMLLFGISFIIIFIACLFLLLLKYTNSLYKKNEKTIYNIAFTDEVTGGSNKNKFLYKAKEILNNSSDDDKYAMISFDITKFKIINELYGYKKANKILTDVYNILSKNLSKGSIVARDFAATFIILYKYDKEDFIVKYFINKVLDDIKIYNNEVMQNLTSNDEYRVTSKLFVTFGIYLIMDKKGSLVQMGDRASIAKRSIKDSVMCSYQFYDDTYRAEMLSNKALEDEMYNALDNHHFQMYLQPKFDLNTMDLKGAEALVRWVHPKKGIIPPIDFIPLFEKNGFIMEVDKCIWSQACEFLSKRKKAGESLFPISVNVSRLHMNNDAFIDELIKLTRTFDIEPKYIELELTESACLNNEKRFIEIMQKLKNYGFAIAMDDFGTGYSSLNMLRHLPVDVLKLDRGFITDSILDSKGKVVIKSILDMASKLNMETVAEGIETPEQAMFLKNAGCKIAQGFLYGRPMDIHKFVLTFLSGAHSEYQDVD